MTSNENKRKERHILKPAGDSHKKKQVLERFFFCPPVVAFTDVEAVLMIVADFLETVPAVSLAARIDVNQRDSAACMMMCVDDDDDVVPRNFSTFVKCVLSRNPRIRVRTVTKRKKIRTHVEANGARQGNNISLSVVV